VTNSEQAAVEARSKNELEAHIFAEATEQQSVFYQSAGGGNRDELREFTALAKQQGNQNKKVELAPVARTTNARRSRSNVT
jgi:hypothetical protein